MAHSSTSTAVHKFGGAALADAAAIRHAAQIIASTPKGAIVVASAMWGVTDELLRIAALAARKDRRAAARSIDALRERHIGTARDLGPSTRRRPCIATIERELEDLLELVGKVARNGVIELSVTDAVAARGERMAAAMLATALATIGTRCKVVDASRVIRTDARHGGATPDFELTSAAAKRYLLPLVADGIVPVVPGFIGSAPDGSVAPLGRGGSDLTATVLARVLGAGSVTLWKDVPGILTADPTVVPDARLLPLVHVREAAELAYYGAKVLHPRALIGLGSETRLYIRPLADPASPGTEVTARRDRAMERLYPVRAITAIGSQAIINISGDGMVGVPGIAARAFGALEKVGVSVSLISQASSEHSICLVVPSSAAKTARSALTAAFSRQIERREVEDIDVRANVAIVAVVGLGMSGTRGVAGRLFAALADASVNVVAIAQGASELNISVVVEEKNVADVQRAVHLAFRLDKIGGGAAKQAASADVVILGYGRIGRELTGQIARSVGSRAVRVVALIDSHGYVFSPRGLPKSSLGRLAASKEAGTSLADAPGGVRADAESAIAEVRRHALSRPILVDVTADETTPVLRAALAGGMDIVLANKRPLAVPRGTEGGLIQQAAARGRRVLYEATVGAGLPIIDTISKLRESGDQVVRIEGCPSGTLGYLFGELGRGATFSDALRAAMAFGYTEPDPREDLSGMDVARKGLILGRAMGFDGELDSVLVESLVPSEYRDIARAEFLARLDELNALWRRRVEEARSRD
jgi:aspartokinase/homoserine dehydrogenase 1